MDERSRAAPDIVPSWIEVIAILVGVVVALAAIVFMVVLVIQRLSSTRERQRVRSECPCG